MTKPKFSIIVPAHNSFNFIQKCLNSIEDQVFDRSAYELIIVCDRCEDDTYKVALQYADKVVTSDWGSDGSRQEGIDVASGEWILFLDDDDWWMHEYVLRMIDEQTDDSTDMILFGFIWKNVGYASPLRHSKALGKDIYWPSVWNKCYRKSFIEGVRFNNINPTPDGKAADIDWTMRLIQKPFSYKALDHALYYYNYLREGSNMYRVYFGEEI